MDRQTKLKIARLKLGLTQQDLAEKVGVSRQTINNFETGKIQPKDKTLDLICEILKIKKKCLK